MADLRKELGLAPERPAIVVDILPNDYDLFIQLFKHRIGFPASYERWHEKAEKEIENLRKRKRPFKVVTVKPQNFQRWCEGSGLKPDFEYLGSFAVAAEAGWK